MPLRCVEIRQALAAHAAPAPAARGAELQQRLALITRELGAALDIVGCSSAGERISIAIAALEIIPELTSAPLDAEKVAADALYEALVGVDPFSGGRDGDECLWCHRDRPREIDTFEQRFETEYHDADCRLIIATAAYRARHAASKLEGRE